MTAGAPLKASALQGVLYTTIVGLLLFWSYMHIDHDLRTDLLKKFCSPNLAKLIHEDGKELSGFAQKFTSAQIPVGAGTDFVISVQDTICDDFEKVINFVETCLFALVIVKATTWVFYAIVLWEPTMVNKVLINGCLVAYLASVIALTLVVACVLEGRVLQFAERAVGLTTEDRKTPEMLLAAIVLAGLFEFVGFLTFAVAVSSIDPQEMLAAQVLEEREIKNPDGSQIALPPTTAAAYGMTKKQDSSTGHYLGTAAVPLNSY